jgi:hypothetical protein
MAVLKKTDQRLSPRLENGFRVLAAALVYSSSFYFFSHLTADTDLWGHIKFGHDLWVSKAFHRYDIYSYTAYGHEWINHEWLSELIMYGLFDLFGPAGLLVGKLLIGFSLVLILSRICAWRSVHSLAYCFVFILAVFVISPGFMSRPQIFTYLYGALFYYIVHLFLERQKNLLWTLPVIMVFWVNSHGGFLIGVGMLPVIVGMEWIACRKKRNDTGKIRKLAYWSLISEMVVLVNPYGPQLIQFLYESLSIPRWIGEWRPVTLLDLSYFRFKALAALFVVSLFGNRGKLRFWEITVIAISLLYAFKHQRHTAVFAVFAAPFIAEQVSRFMRRLGLDKKIRATFSYSILSVVFLLLIAFQITFKGRAYLKNDFNIIVEPRIFPVYAVHFLKQNKATGNILLPFEWGEYVIWKCHPACRVSIDGRFRTVYPEEVLRDHLDAKVDESKQAALIEKYPTDIILARRSLFFERMISGQKDWIYIYSDPLTILFVKNNEQNSDLLNRFDQKRLVYPKKRLSSYFP